MTAVQNEDPIIQYRRIGWNTTKTGKPSPLSLRAVERVLVGLIIALVLVAGMGLGTQPALAVGWAYLWANEPFSASYKPDSRYQFNSNSWSDPNTIVRTGVGAYTALLPNLGAWAGHVQVTAYGTGSERCHVVGWSPSGSTQQVRVKCFTSAGAPVDTAFTMTYVSGISLIGSPCCEPGTLGDYAWANEPFSASYRPDPRYSYNDDSLSSPTITRVGVGTYVYKLQAPFTGTFRDGTVQVTAYGAESNYCKVVFWTPEDGVHVQCFSSAGAPVDTSFVVMYLWAYYVA